MSDSNNWIDINLPWASNLEVPEYPEKAVNDAVFAEFGFTEYELFERFREKHGISAHVAGCYETGCYETGCYEDLPVQIEAAELLEKVADINDFIDKTKIPEVETWKQECIKRKICFRDSELNRPGVLIEVKTSNGIERFLLGTINCNAGVCDDCTAFNRDDIILRAKVLISKDMIND